ncbi:MAG: lignostilbene-alpha,beta-dioxygenase [Betaproteobacteria bacterium]|nr:lignostilbene-alpha,beta-dioxygenase [Betaproteobacteria bacterium]
MNDRTDPQHLDAPFGDEYGPLLTGVYAPLTEEYALEDPKLTKGRIPSDLNGVYLRAGPNARYAPNGRYHPFDGDGMVHAAHFRSGRLTYRNRWVQTDGFKEEVAAGKSTHYGIRETLKGRSDRRLKDTANTDLVGHRGRALALWYMSGDAYEIDPITLETLGKSQAICQSGGKISAHAKVDEITEEVLFFDYGNDAPYMHYGVVGADGALRHHVPIDLPGPRLPHDMAVTEHWSILHDLPLFHDHEAMVLGRHKIDFHPELKSRFGVIGRYAPGESIRWFDFSPCYLYHVVNAWEDGDWVVMVGCRYMPALDAQGGIDAHRTAKDVAELVMRARLWEWKMNLRTGETAERMLNGQHNAEFPTCNGRLTGRKTRYGYLIDHSETVTLKWSAVRKYNLFTGEDLGAWSDDPQHSWYSEPCFAQADHPSAEDHGYVVAFQWNDALKRQTLDVFDARNLARGPIAQVELPHRLPAGFHACWIEADRLARR